MKAQSAAIRVMLVDDHQVVRAGLRTLLSQVEALEIVGEAATAAAAVAEALRLRPEVVLMDLRLPDASGVEACREIVSAAPEIKVLFLTSHSDQDAVMSTVLSGAAGYLIKDIRHEALIGAILDAAAGRPVFDSRLAHGARTSVERTMHDEHARDALSAQERRVLALVVDGRTNKEIAAALQLSDKTVKNYLSNAFQKLGVNRRAQAAALYARKAAQDRSGNS